MKIKVDELKGARIKLPPSGPFLELDLVFNEEQARDIVYLLCEQFGDDWLIESLTREGYIFQRRPTPPDAGGE